MKTSRISLKKSRDLLLSTSLFDEHWYRKTYRDVLASPLDPIEYYLQHGEAAGHWPNPYFNAGWYKKTYAAARRSKLPAVLHYALEGWQKNRDPSHKFCTEIYRAQYPDVDALNISPLQHFLQIGRYEGNLAFACRLRSIKDGKALIADMLLIQESGLFDRDWYEQYYDDLLGKDIDPLFHFVSEGAAQNRKANPIFEPQWYKERYGHMLGDKNPLCHFILEGEKKLYDPAPDFSTKAYYARHSDLDKKTGSALSHYLANGFHHGEKKPSALESAKPQKQYLKSAKLPLDGGLRAMIDYDRTALAPTSKLFNSKRLNIHWVIPDFAAGGGGHMTIFRMVSFFERFGHRQTIWINNPTMHKTASDAADDILKHFQQFTGQVNFLDARFAKAEGDAIIATDCWTAWPVLSAANFKRRFYFVQDFEPSFHPMGSAYLAAEQTYHEDFDCICASPWLSQLMAEKYGRWARPFWLAADTDLYHPPQNKRENKHLRIAFYARHFTARRAVELGLLALETLANRGIEFEVDFFGAPVEFKSAPFKFKDHGVASPEQLASLFQQADIGVVFSATNYSLVPQEMMACGLPIVELKGESTECIFPDGTVSLAEPHPASIADALAKLISNPDDRQKQAKAALSWVKGFSWKASAKLVEDALIDRLREIGEDTADTSPKEKPSSPHASVVIPTYNAGPILDRVLKAVTKQNTPWPYEILVIDSGSTDETLATIAKYPDVRLHRIDKKDFNHGDTRNLGVALTQGDFIAFLTHDALPANENWLANLVSSIEKDPKIAGAFGKHLAYPEASTFTKRDLNAHFEMLNGQPLVLNKETNKARFDNNDQGWRQLLHFYSDNNSCMRRSVWKKIPYRAIKFGEDQVWADDIIKAGYSKIYAVRAVVYHSHDFNPTETYDRSLTEAAFFKHFFQYRLIKNEQELVKTLADLNRYDETWAKENGLSDAEISERWQQNEARLRGYLDGANADTSDMF